MNRDVEYFFKTHRKTKKPLLIGFSGGEDSLALAHCLYSLGEKIHLAHFDHRWREASRKESAELKKWADERGIPFFSAYGDGQNKTELAAREERYAFFRELFQSGQYEALVLAHQRDDQVETVLKRVLEGAPLPLLKGMRSVGTLKGLTIFRPLLEVSKEEVRKYLSKWSLDPIIDQTNKDLQYLRARFRYQLIPQLQSELGKEVVSSLIRIGDYSAELDDYLNEKTASIKPIEGPMGVMWDFSLCHRLEVRTVLTKWFRERGRTLSYKVLESIFLALETKRANFKVTASDLTLIVDRGFIFILLGPGPWSWHIRAVEEREEQKGWQSFWKGKILILLPIGEYELIEPTPKARKKLNQAHVPAFLRDILPVLVQNQDVVGDFFTGVWGKKITQESYCVEVTFSKNEQNPPLTRRVGEKSKIMLP